VTPQHFTTGPGATLPGPVADLLLVVFVVLTAGLPLGLFGNPLRPTRRKPRRRKLPRP
jgi:hypothetical protein